MFLAVFVRIRLMKICRYVQPVYYLVRRDLWLLRSHLDKIEEHIVQQTRCCRADRLSPIIGCQVPCFFFWCELISFLVRFVHPRQHRVALC